MIIAILAAATPGIGLAQYSSRTGLPIDLPPGAPAITGPVDEARVVLSCLVVRGGSLRDCNVVSEDPPGSGVGAGALKIAKTVKIAGQAPGTRIRVPIKFLITEDPEPPAKP